MIHTILKSYLRRAHMTKLTKIIICMTLVVVVFISCIVSSSAYGGSELRTDISSNITTYRLNTPSILLSNINTGKGFFVDNSLAWHDNRDYYGNGSIKVTDYRQNTEYSLPFLYNYSAPSQGAPSRRNSSLFYTVPETVGYTNVIIQYAEYTTTPYDTIQLASRYIDDNATGQAISVTFDVRDVEIDEDTQMPRYILTTHTVTYNPTIVNLPSEISPIGNAKAVEINPSVIVRNVLGNTYIGKVYNLRISYDATYIGVGSFEGIRINNRYENYNQNGLTEADTAELNKAIKAFASQYNPSPIWDNIFDTIYTAVGGFFAMEIMPNFTMGHIVGICVAFALLGIVIKKYAGG